MFYRCTLLWQSSTLVEEKPLCFTAVLYSFLFQRVISEVTVQIPFKLSHNIRSWCNLISPPKVSKSQPPQKTHPITPKNGHYGDRVGH